MGPSGSTKSCDGCLSWTIASAITWGASFITGKEPDGDKSEGSGYFLDTGTWSARPGAVLTDAIFPHVVHRFRGRTLPVVTFHVSCTVKFCDRLRYFLVICFQNPPWQIIDRNKTGLAMFDGLIFDVLKELSMRLNFTYSVLVASEDENKNKSSSGNKVRIWFVDFHLCRLFISFIFSLESRESHV